MAEIKKTNVARILDKQKISYELIPYVVDENDLGAQHVADSLGEPGFQVHPCSRRQDRLPHVRGSRQHGSRPEGCSKSQWKQENRNSALKGPDTPYRLHPRRLQPPWP